MLKALRSFFDYLIFGNWFISFGAVSLTLQTYLMLNKPMKIDALLCLIFFSTLFEYNLHRFLSLRKTSSSLQPNKFSWAKEHYNLFILTLAFSVIGFLASALFIKFDIVLILTPLALITIAYSFPLIKSKNSRIRLRELSAFKILFVAFVWGIATVIIPVVNDGLSIFSTDVLYMTLRRILFVFAITIPFDIRDRDTDLEEGLKTIPIILGERNSKLLAFFLLMLFSLLIFLQYNNPFGHHCGQDDFSIPLYFSVMITSFLVFKSTESNGKYFHYFWVDGMMILQFVLIVIYNSFILHTN